MAIRIRTRVDSDARGPLFDDRARRYFDEFAEELGDDGAEWALDDIKRTFHTHFKDPTGYYESNVRIRNGSEGPEVWDGGMAGPVYGPWLEGVGSRNSPVTRFRGYGAFRKAATRLQQRIEAMGYRLFDSNYQSRF